MSYLSSPFPKCFIVYLKVLVVHLPSLSPVESGMIFLLPLLILKVLAWLSSRKMLPGTLPVFSFSEQIKSWITDEIPLRSEAFLSLPGIRTVASSSIQGLERRKTAQNKKTCPAPSLPPSILQMDSQPFCWLSLSGRKGQQHSVVRSPEV